MNKKQFATNVKRLREASGLTQENLAETSRISLRTIQRIESAEVTPRSDTIIMLSNALNISPAELADWSVKENTKYLAAVNLSALTYMISPPLGVVAPLIMWLNKRDQIKGLEKTSKKVINFQITWMILFMALIIFCLTKIFLFLGTNGFDVTFESDIAAVKFFLLRNGLFLIPVLIFYNIVITIVNAVRANNGKEERYFPSIPFFKYK